MRPQVLYPREMGVELLLICPGWDLAQLLWGAGIPILSGNWRLTHRQPVSFSLICLQPGEKREGKTEGEG